MTGWGGECLGWRRPGGRGGSRLGREGQEEAEMPPLPGNKPFPKPAVLCVWQDAPDPIDPRL